MIWDCARETHVPSDQSHGATLNESVSRTCAAESLATTLLLGRFLGIAFGVGVVYGSTKACDMAGVRLRTRKLVANALTEGTSRRDGVAV